MLQFVSDNLENLNIQYYAVEALVTRTGAIGVHGLSQSQPTVEFLEQDSVLRNSRGWPNLKVQLQRELRTESLQGGTIWVREKMPGEPGVVLMASRRSASQMSLPFLRLALNRLRRWAERNRVTSVALRGIGRGLEISPDQIRQMLYQQLGDSRCQFWAEESGFQAVGLKPAMSTKVARRQKIASPFRSRLQSISRSNLNASV